jgi:hypothetical protein
VTETNAVYQTISTANGQGYTSSNDFSPTAASNSTVTALGANEAAAFCADSVLHNATAEGACVKSTTGGCVYNSTSHNLICPGVPPNPRPVSGAWGVGAYQPAMPAPAINLTATPSN